MMKISDEAVEAAVLAIYDHRIPISEDEVRIILDAALPYAEKDTCGLPQCPGFGHAGGATRWQPTP